MTATKNEIRLANELAHLLRAIESGRQWAQPAERVRVAAQHAWAVLAEVQAEDKEAQAEADRAWAVLADLQAKSDPEEARRQRIARAAGRQA